MYNILNHKLNTPLKCSENYSLLFLLRSRRSIFDFLKPKVRRFEVFCPQTVDHQIYLNTQREEDVERKHAKHCGQGTGGQPMEGRTTQGHFPEGH